METRPILSSSRCNNGRIKRTFIHSSNYTNPPNHQKSRDQESPGYHIDNPGLANAEVLPRPSAFINKKPTYSRNERKITNKSKGRCYPLVKKGLYS